MQKPLIKKSVTIFIVYIACLSMNLNSTNHAVYQSFSSIPWSRLAAVATISCCGAQLVSTLVNDYSKLQKCLRKENPTQDILGDAMLSLVSAPYGLTNSDGYSTKSTAMEILAAKHFYKSNFLGIHNVFKTEYPTGVTQLRTVSQMAWNELKKGNFPGAIIRILIMGIPFCNTSTLFTVEGNLKFPWQPNSIQ